MRRIAIVAAIVLAGGAAHAAETAPPVSPVCMPLEKFKATLDAKTKFKTATIGQFHVFEGIYIGNPHTPEGLPPGDGVLMATPPPPHGQPAATLIAWTQHSGKDVCGGPRQTLVVPSDTLAVILGINTGKDEISDPADDPKDELRL